MTSQYRSLGDIAESVAGDVADVEFGVFAVELLPTRRDQAVS